MTKYYKPSDGKFSGGEILYVKVEDGKIWAVKKNGGRRLSYWSKEELDNYAKQGWIVEFTPKTRKKDSYKYYVSVVAKEKGQKFPWFFKVRGNECKLSYDKGKTFEDYSLSLMNEMVKKGRWVPATKEEIFKSFIVPRYFKKANGEFPNTDYVVVKGDETTFVQKDGTEIRRDYQTLEKCLGYCKTAGWVEVSENEVKNKTYTFTIRKIVDVKAKSLAEAFVKARAMAPYGYTAELTD